jgi:cellulose synthase/poly-beta-1,6-N-acetylglucosamine synthase-like glycosyltransferase
LLLSVLFVCLTALAISSVLLLALGHRLRVGSRLISVVVALLFVLVTGELAARFWLLPSRYVVEGEVYLLAVTVLVVLARPMWNPLAHLFLASTVAAAVAYLALAGWVTVAGGLSVLGILASALLFLLETAAFVIAVSFSFESCDVVCRTRWTRVVAPPDPSYRPKVSLHVPAFAEPPDMLIETIGSLEAIDYPDLEIVVIDNNTPDEELWRPVELYCQGRDRVHFVHVDPWPGYKSGALNLALRAHTDPAAEIIGIVDADYLVRPEYLRRLVGLFADPQLAFVQTPQDYREWEGDRYLTSCYDAYRYFFETAMPSRNERNSIIFGGTMGLIRRSVLEEIGGWDEACITEDAEASLRILRAGYSGIYVNESFGRGVMPLTFAALKRQMFRWCFGGIQILRKHGRSLLPWDRDPDNHLSLAQRTDYLVGGLQWFGSLVSLGFSMVLLVIATMLLIRGKVNFAPVLGAAILLPVTILVSGFVRAIWALRHRAHISYLRAVFAFMTWLSLSWTIGLACIQGLVRSEGVFLRTPKSREQGRFREALRAARVETGLALCAWGLAAATLASGRAGPLLGVLFFWQGGVYAASPAMAWLNQHSHLSARLERRRRFDERRYRLAALRAHPMAQVSAGVVATLAAAVLLVITLGAGPGRTGLFAAPRRAPTDMGPLGNLGILPHVQGSPLSPSPSMTAPGTGTRGGNGGGGAGSTTTTNPHGATTTTTNRHQATTTTNPHKATTTTNRSATTTTNPSATTTTNPHQATTTTNRSATTTTNPHQATTTTNPHQATTTTNPHQATTTTNPHQP